jgi:PAS domain S-box-containing protein
VESLYSKLSVGLCFLDTGLRYVRINEKLASMNGAPVAAHIGRGLREMIAPAVADVVEPLYRRVLESGEPVLDQEIRGSTDGSMEGNWLVGCSPAKSDDGKVLGVQVVVQDITERKRFEEKLRHTGKLESLGVLAGGIAHDFNNLLTGILGNASLALDSLPSNHSVSPLLQDAIKASERASDLTRQLLAYAGKGRFVIEPVDLSALVREIQPLIGAAINKSAEVCLELSGRHSLVAADAGQLQQLIMNLVINGGEAIPAGQSGTVTVRTGEQEINESYIRSHSLIAGEQLTPGTYVFLEVSDTGSGMDAATLERIFDPFFTTKFTGRGLGLAAVSGIVRGHRGALSVSTMPGRGTSFRVLLPATQQEPAVPEEAAAPQESRTGQLLLVVDDEEIVRRTARASLERYGYRVLLAETGPEAIQMFARFAPEIAVVVLDLTMPGMDGEHACRELKRIRADAKIILSSGYDESEVARRFETHELAGFVQKPYTAATLVNKVTSVVLQGAAQSTRS